MATQLSERPAVRDGGVPDPRPGYDRALLRRLLATRTFKTGEFTLASGRRSRMYFNVKTTMMHPAGAAQCARGLIEILDRLPVDYIGGLEMGAVPLLSVIAASSADGPRPIPSFFVRKKPKAHGTQALIEGLDDIGDTVESLDGKRVVLIDDVATSGGSIVQAVDQIVAAGGIVTDAIVVLDREEGAEAALAARGIALHALFTAAELGVTAAHRAPLD